MPVADATVATAARLGTAALIGLVVGLEREWSGHSSGPSARFAGLRTFMLIGLLGGSAGLFAREGYELPAAAILAATAAMCISAYVVSVRNDPADRDGTTEVAAILVAVLGAVACAVSWSIAAAAGSLVVVALNEKKRLHGVVTRVHPEELSAALRFAVLALVVLPLLPEGPYLGWADVRPRALWFVVLLLCAINFAGFLARRAASAGRGYVLTGLLGGVISSTVVTLGFARASRQNPQSSTPLAVGVIAACTVLVPRVLVISGVLNPDVAVHLLPFILPAGLIGAGAVAFAWRFGQKWSDEGPVPVTWVSADDKSPLRLWMAIKLAIVFQLAIIVVAWARTTMAIQGLYGTAVILGLTDVDALTVSMSVPSAALVSSIASRAIATGILANTVVKLGISMIAGTGQFRVIVSAILLAMIALIAAALAIV
jgi:uncharacterized membrane protein (DUF4010 family)